MRLEEYVRYDAVGLSDLIRAGEVTGTELVSCALSAAETSTPYLNAFAEIYRDLLDHGMTCQGLGPFSGVPFAIKDAGPLEAGRGMTYGSRLFQDFLADADSPLALRFRSTGLVNIGRTTCSELEITATVETAAYGATHNPWNLDLSTAGSSGGSAAAVAAGVVPIAHGRDGGGSVRMPAACCGVVGLKPTRGRISTAPDRAPLGELSGDGILARSVRDVAALLGVMQGGGPGDAYHIAPLPRGFESQLESTPALRIGVLEGHLGGGPVQPEIEAAITAIAETCERMHHHLVEFDVDLPYDEYVQATLDLWCVETAAAVAAISSGAASGPTDLPMEGLTASWVERGRALTAGDVVNALEILHHVSRRMALASGDLDVLLSATLPTLPLPLGIYDGGANLPAAWYFDSPIGMLERTTMVFNCTGQPAISLPLSSTPDGIPIGVHLAAGQGREDLLLSLAHSLEQAHPWSHRRPPFGVEFLQGLEQTSRSNGRDARA